MKVRLKKFSKQLAYVPIAIGMIILATVSISNAEVKPLSNVENSINVDVSASIKKEEKMLSDNAASGETSYIVKFKNEVVVDEKQKVLQKINAEEIGSGRQKIFVIKGKAALAEVKKMGSGVVSIEKDCIRSADSTPNDAFLRYQWNLYSLDALTAWESVPENGSNTIVAVIDSGISASHEDLGGRVLNGYNYVMKDNSVYDSTGHGTAVSGIIAANRNNGIGIAGISSSCDILPLHVIGVNNQARASDEIEAIYDATDWGAKIINLSLSGVEYIQAEKDAIDYAISHGVVVVAASGNDENSSLHYPASYNGVISVGSVDATDSKSSFSQFNNAVDVVAPGENILTTSAQSDSAYSYVDGTSFSTPEVSGIVALMLAKNPSLTVSQIDEILKRTSVDLGTPGRDDYFGYGKVNASSAVSCSTASEVYINSFEPNNTNSQVVNELNQWFCSTSGSGGLVQCQFWAHKQGEPWQIVQPYSSDNYLNWTPTSAGDYEIGVWVKDLLSTAAYDKLLIKPYKIKAADPVIISSLASDKAAPQIATTNVNWTCNATGGSSLRYQYWAHKVGEPWQMVQAYSQTNTLEWTPQVAGDYEIGVWVKSASSGAAYDSLLIKPYSVSAENPVNIVAMTSDKATQVAGSFVVWTCNATGGSSLRYQYWAHKVGEPWQMVQAYSQTNTLEWTPQVAGDYEIGVWVKNASSGAAYDSLLIKPYSVSAAPVPPVSIASMTSGDETSVAGSSVGWTCNANGGNSLRYQYWAHKVGEPWQMVQAYSQDNTLLWTPQVAGDYEIGVWVKDVSSGAAYDSLLIKPYSVTAAPVTNPVSIVAMTSDKVTQVAGSSVAWTCNATGGSSLRYQYWAHKMGEPWQMVQAYSQTNTLAWTPQVAGDYEIGVWVKDVSSGAAYDSLLIKPYSVSAAPVTNSVSIVAMTSDEATQVAGSSVAWTCNATGGSSLRYQYWAHKMGEPWQMVQAYSQTNTLAWTPQAAGDYEIGVWVKDVSSGAAYDSLLIKPYSVTAAPVTNPVSIVAMTSDKATQVAGSSVAWTCNATGGSSLRYQYWAHKMGEPWQMVQAYSQTNTLAWTPQDAGDYEIGVWVKDVSSGAAYDSLLIKPYSISAARVANPVVINWFEGYRLFYYDNVPVTFTCNASGGNTLNYQYWVHKVGEPWQIIQSYNQSNVLNWTPLSPGQYEIGAWVKDTLSDAPYDCLQIFQIRVSANPGPVS